MDYTIQFVCPDAPKKNRANIKTRIINSHTCRNLFGMTQDEISVQKSEELRQIRKKRKTEHRNLQQKPHVTFVDSQKNLSNEKFESFVKELHILCEKYMKNLN